MKVVKEGQRVPVEVLFRQLGGDTTQIMENAIAAARGQGADECDVGTRSFVFTFYLYPGGETDVSYRLNRKNRPAKVAATHYQNE